MTTTSASNIEPKLWTADATAVSKNTLVVMVVSCTSAAIAPRFGFEWLLVLLPTFNSVVLTIPVAFAAIVLRRTSSAAMLAGSLAIITAGFATALAGILGEQVPLWFFAWSNLVSSLAILIAVRVASLAGYRLQQGIG